MRNEFESFSPAALCAQFSEKLYPKDAETRLCLLQEFENRISALNGRAALTIKPIPMDEIRAEPSLSGYYSYSEPDSLYINPLYLTGTRTGQSGFSPADALDTIVHEGRHAYQHLLVARQPQNVSRALLLEWAMNFQGYQCGSDQAGLALYGYKSIELDARRCARNVLNVVQARIQDFQGAPDAGFGRKAAFFRRVERMWAGLVLANLTEEELDRRDRIARESFRKMNPNLELPIDNTTLFAEARSLFTRCDDLSDHPGADAPDYRALHREPIDPNWLNTWQARARVASRR